MKYAIYKIINNRNCMPKKLSKHVKAQETIPVPIISNDSKKQKIYEKLIKQYDAVFKVLAKN